MPSDQIDISKIKVGDEVTVRAKVVTLAQEAELPICIRLSKFDTWINSSDIISHTPKALEVGDRVRDFQGREWEIVAPRRPTEDGSVEYSVWCSKYGYATRSANYVESWERLDAQ